MRERSGTIRFSHILGFIKDILIIKNCEKKYYKFYMKFRVRVRVYGAGLRSGVRGRVWIQVEV